MVKAGQFDDKLPQIWQELQQARKAAAEAAVAAQQRATEESAARAAAAAAARVPGKPVAVPNKLKRPQAGLRLKTALDPATTGEGQTAQPVVEMVDNVKVFRVIQAF